MTNIQPLTSEEVLAKQVQENSKHSEDRIAVSKLPVAVTSTPQTAPAPPAKDQKKESQELKRAGFTYRMPVGVHLLSFVYLEIFIALFLYAVGLVALRASSGPLELAEIGGVVSRDTGIAIVLTLAMTIFIISGREILRKSAIGIAVVLAGILSYQLYMAISNLVDASVATLLSMAFFSVFVFAGIAVSAAGLILMLVTIIYLSRKKIAAIYE